MWGPQPASLQGGSGLKSWYSYLCFALSLMCGLRQGPNLSELQYLDLSAVYLVNVEC